MSIVPSPRYRVIEQGRRLVVIDTWADGHRPGSAPRPARVEPTRTTPRSTDPMSPGDTPRSSLLPQRTRFDGSAQLTTHSLYDERGPRTILLDPGSMDTVNGVKITLALAAFLMVVVATFEPWVLIAPLLLINPKVRQMLRKHITIWLDRVAEGKQPQG